MSRKDPSRQMQTLKEVFKFTIYSILFSMAKINFSICFLLNTLFHIRYRYIL